MRMNVCILQRIVGRVTAWMTSREPIRWRVCQVEELTSTTGNVVHVFSQSSASRYLFVLWWFRGLLLCSLFVCLVPLVSTASISLLRRAGAVSGGPNCSGRSGNMKPKNKPNKLFNTTTQQFNTSSRRMRLLVTWSLWQEIKMEINTLITVTLGGGKNTLLIPLHVKLCFVSLTHSAQTCVVLKCYRDVSGVRVFIQTWERPGKVPSD